MIWKNIEIHNVAELIPGELKDGIKWIRVPEEVHKEMETESGQRQAKNCTGVELRFVMKSDTVTLRMRTARFTGVYHVYRGSIQGGFEDHEIPVYPTDEVRDFVIKKSGNPEMLERITKDFEHPFSPEVVRVIFDRGGFELLDVIGEVEPPTKEMLPAKTMLCYGSSITHGSNALDMSHTWTSLTAYNLKMDVRNLGLAGSCWMEPKLIEYLAREGEEGKWDLAVLELGINVLDWEKQKIRQRVNNVLEQVAGRNPEKPIFIISPFYSVHDYKQDGKAQVWRDIIEQIIQERNDANVTYIDGMELLGDMSLISADGLHPNIYGVAQIAERLTERIRSIIQ